MPGRCPFEWITTLGAYPSLETGSLCSTRIATMLRESLETEAASLAHCRELPTLVEERSIALDEFARQMIQAEEMHASEVDNSELHSSMQRSRYVAHSSVRWGWA